MEISSVSSLLAASLAVETARKPEAAVVDRELIRAVKKVNESEFLGAQNELTIVVDRERRRALVRIVDRETGEVIQQIPPEYVLRMADELTSAQ